MATEHPPEGLEQLGCLANDLNKELMTFARLGHILRRRGVNSLTQAEIERALWDDYREQVSGKTLKERLHHLADLFGQYFTQYLDRVPSSLEFFELVQGRPMEILTDGWEAWEETVRYFSRKGLSLKSFPDEQNS